jgi:acyl carrier protein
MQDVKAMVRRFLLDTVVMAGDIEIGDEASFMDQHILDSTGFMELIAFVEETFGVTVDDRDMLPENFDSLRNIEDFVARKRAARAVA